MVGQRRTRSQKSPAPKTGKARRAARAANNDPPSSPTSPDASNITRTRDPTPQPQVPPTPSRITRQSARIRGQSAEPLVALPDTTTRKRKAPAPSQNILDPIEDEEDGEASPSKRAKLEHTADSEVGEAEIYEEHIKDEGVASPTASIPSPNYNGESPSQASPTDDDIDDLLRTARRDSEIQDTPRSPVGEDADEIIEQPESQPYNSASPIHDNQSPLAPTSSLRKRSASLESLDQNTEHQVKRQKSSPIESHRPLKSPRQSSTPARIASRRASQDMFFNNSSTPFVPNFFTNFSPSPPTSTDEDASTYKQPIPSHTDVPVIDLSDISSEHSQEVELQAAPSSLEVEASASEQLMQSRTDEQVIGLSNTGVALQEDQPHADSLAALDAHVPDQLMQSHTDQQDVAPPAPKVAAFEQLPQVDQPRADPSAVLETHTSDQLLESHTDQHAVEPLAPRAAAVEQLSQADQTQATFSQSVNHSTSYVPRPPPVARRERLHRERPEPIDYDNPKVNAWEEAENIAYEIGLGQSPSSRKKPFRITLPPRTPTIFTMEKYRPIGQRKVLSAKDIVHINKDENAETLWNLAKLFDDFEQGKSVDATGIISKLEELSKGPSKASSDELAPMFEYHLSEVARERGQVYQRPADRIIQTPRAPTAAAQETQSVSQAARRPRTPKAPTSALHGMKSAGPAFRSTRTLKTSTSAVQETQSAAPASRTMRRPKPTSTAQEMQSATPAFHDTQRLRVRTSSVREHRAGSSTDTLQSADYVHSRSATGSRKTAGFAAPGATNRLSKPVSGGTDKSESRNHGAQKDLLKSSRSAASSASNRLSESVSGATENNETINDQVPSSDETGMAPGEAPLRDVTGLYPQALVAMNTIRESRGWKLRYPIPPEFLAQLEEQEAKRKQAMLDRRQPSRIPADDDYDEDYVINTSSRMGTSAASGLGYSQSQSLYGAPSRSPVKRVGPPTKPVETSSIDSRVFRNGSNTPATSIQQPASTATADRSILTNEKPRPRYRHKRKHNAGPLDRGYFHIGPELMLDTDDEYETEWEGEDGILVEDLPKSTKTAASAQKIPKKADQRNQQKASSGYGLSDSEDDVDDEPAPPPAKTPLKGILKKPANKNTATPYEKKSVSMALAHEKGPLTETPGNKRAHSAASANTPSTTPKPKNQYNTNWNPEGASFRGYATQHANERKKQMEELQKLATEGKSENEDLQQAENEGHSQNQDLHIENEGEDEDEDQGINDIRKEVNMFNTKGTEVRPEIATKISELHERQLETSQFYSEIEKVLDGVSPDEWSEHGDDEERPTSGRA